ncbi:hypothetical protein C8R45DRAFT_1102269 [Mycena sanguinolenta]|nr:hypothetical protein C8R45DRAFT_1102269 [Mycena sanguinolenta]
MSHLHTIAPDSSEGIPDGLLMEGLLVDSLNVGDLFEVTHVELTKEPIKLSPHQIRRLKRALEEQAGKEKTARDQAEQDRAQKQQLLRETAEAEIQQILKPKVGGGKGGGGGEGGIPGKGGRGEAPQVDKSNAHYFQGIDGGEGGKGGNAVGATGQDGKGGEGEGPKFGRGMTEDFPDLNPPDVKLEDLRLHPDLLALLKDQYFEDVGGLSYVTDVDLGREGFSLGHIAQLKAALRVQARKERQALKKQEAH